MNTNVVGYEIENYINRLCCKYCNGYFTKGGEEIMAMEALVRTGNLILDPLYALWYDIIAILPSLVLAVLLLILGYAVAYLIAHVVKVVLEKILGKVLREAHLTKNIGHTNVAGLLGEVTKWFVFLIFLDEAVSILNLSRISSVLGMFVQWLPNLLVAILVLFGGVALAHYIDMKVREHTNMRGMLVMSGIVKVVVLFLAVLIGLKQIGINVDVLQSSFLLIVGAVAVGLALAFGISFGLGMRKDAEGYVKRMKKYF